MGTETTAPNGTEIRSPSPKRGAVSLRGVKGDREEASVSLTRLKWLVAYGDFFLCLAWRMMVNADSHDDLYFILFLPGEFYALRWRWITRPRREGVLLVMKDVPRGHLDVFW